MPFVQAKCPECGGMLAVDADKKAAVCQFCGEAFIVQEAINNYNTYNETINNYNTTHQYGEGAVVNVYEDQNKDFVIEAGVLKEYHGESVDVVIPNNVYEIGANAFENKKIKNITLSEKITEIGRAAFSGCSKLTSITIPNGVTEIGTSAFSGCSSLTDITIPDSVTKIGTSAFSGCSSLTRLTIPDSVTVIRTHTFQGCSNLLEITLPQSVTYIGPEAFGGCDKLSSINYDISWSWISVDFDNFVGEPHASLITQHMSLKGEFEIPSGIKRIGKGCFTYCTELESVIIPDTVTEIDDYAFCNCTNLVKIKIPNSVIKIGNHAFDGCTALTEIVIPDSVTDIGISAFRNCRLNKITISNVLLNEEIATACMNITVHVISPMQKSFRDLLEGTHRYIKEVRFSNDLVKIQGLNDCIGLTSIIIPKGVTEIGELAFVRCKNLKEVTISDSVTNIGFRAFEECPIKKVNIPSNAQIGEFAFSTYWRSKGLCPKCGGSFNFVGKCKNCGRKK